MDLFDLNSFRFDIHEATSKLESLRESLGVHEESPEHITTADDLRGVVEVVSGVGRDLRGVLARMEGRAAATANTTLQAELAALEAELKMETDKTVALEADLKALEEA